MIDKDKLTLKGQQFYDDHKDLIDSIKATYISIAKSRDEYAFSMLTNIFCTCAEECRKHLEQADILDGEEAGEA